MSEDVQHSATISHLLKAQSVVKIPRLAKRRVYATNNLT